MNPMSKSGKRESGKAETFNCQARGMAASALDQPQRVAVRTARENCKTIRCANGARPSSGAARLTGEDRPCLLRLPTILPFHEPPVHWNHRLTLRLAAILPLLGERAGVRADVSSSRRDWLPFRFKGAMRKFLIQGAPSLTAFV